MSRFAVEHRFSGRARDVIGVLLDPAFHEALVLPDVALVEPPTLATGGDGGPSAVDGRGGRLQLRYEFVGDLDPLARRLLGGRRLTWTQQLTLDPSTGQGSLRFAADADPRRLHGEAAIRVDDHGQGSTRRIEGDLRVEAPAIGRTAERRLLPGLLRRLDLEAAAVEERLGRLPRS